MLNFQELYETYAGDVYRFVLWLAGDRFEAEDVSSETFIRAWAIVIGLAIFMAFALAVLAASFLISA